MFVAKLKGSLKGSEDRCDGEFDIGAIGLGDGSLIWGDGGAEAIALTALTALIGVTDVSIESIGLDEISCCAMGITSNGESGAVAIETGDRLSFFDTVDS
jgi:hypothetical protein